MTDFQIALVSAAAVIVIGVLIFNRWQEAKYRKRAEQSFTGSHADVLIDGAAASSPSSPSSRERVEPQLGALPEVDDLEFIGDYNSPLVDQPIVPKDAESTILPALNAEVDAIALIMADAPLTPEQYHPAIAATGVERILWEGLVEGMWRPIDPADDMPYRELRAGIQLANRGGPIDATALYAFGDMIGHFAEGLGAVCQREDAEAALLRAQKLDAFCADNDVEIAVNLIGKSGTTFATTKVRGLAEAGGMVARAVGQGGSGATEYDMRDELGRTLFTLRAGGDTQGFSGAYLTGLTLALDAPRTPQPVRTFERMFQLALQFADTLHGELVDDNQKTLTANGRRQIAESIAAIAAGMEKRGIVPGSSVALRLYS